MDSLKGKTEIFSTHSDQVETSQRLARFLYFHIEVNFDSFCKYEILSSTQIIVLVCDTNFQCSDGHIFVDSLIVHFPWNSMTTSTN